MRRCGKSWPSPPHPEPPPRRSRSLIARRRPNSCCKRDVLQRSFSGGEEKKPFPRPSDSCDRSLLSGRAFIFLDNRDALVFAGGSDEKKIHVLVAHAGSDVFGWLFGFFYRYLVQKSPNELWVWILTSPFLLLLNINGADTKKALGGLLIYFLTVAILRKYLVRVIDPFLRVR